MPWLGSLSDLFVRVFGWHGLMLHGDQTIFDRWRWVRRLLRPGPLRTLDAGCGAGAFALYAARRGNEVVGLNWDQHDVRTAEGRARLLGLESASFRAQDLRELHAVADELGSFDQIICFEVIEHIIDDAKLVRDLAVLLRPGGRMLITTPSDRHLTIPGEYVATEEDGGHVRYGYSHADLRHLAENASLEVTSLGYLVGPLSQAILRVYFRLARVSTLLGWAVTVPMRLLPIFDGILARVVPLPPLCVTAIFTKPRT